MNDRTDMTEADMPQRPALLHSPRVWACAALLVGFVVLSAAFQSTPIDDAYISFRYIDQWVRGNGLVFNPGERVEGYSNLLWVVILAIPARIGMKPPVVAPLLEIVFALGCVFLLWLGSRTLFRDRKSIAWELAAPLLLALYSGFLFWIGKGMETIFYTFLQVAFAVIVLAFREREGLGLRQGLALGLLAAAAALTRPEGLMAPGAVLALLFVMERGRRKAYLVALGILLLAVAGQFAFRLAYYGPLWPNTYYAKHVPLKIALEMGFLYLQKLVGLEQEGWFYPKDWTGYLPFWIVCTAAMAFAAKRWRRLWPLALQTIVLVAVPVYVGGDWMPAFRFFLPAIPLACLLIVAGLREIAGGETAPRWRAVPSWALLAVLLVAELVGLVRTVSCHEFGRWQHHLKNYGPMADWLHENASEGSLVALSDIGIISYRNPTMQFLDVLGLTDAHIAKVEGLQYVKTDVDYVLDRKPDYVLGMLLVWPDTGRVQLKTPRFDPRFHKHVEEHKDYESLTRVRGWREGMKGDCWVLFDIYARTDIANAYRDEATTAGVVQ